MNEQSTIAPADIEADFVFCCQDDSMMGANLSSGSLVFIRACDDVEDGHIAAVRIGDSFVLRRVYRWAGYLELRAENPEYPPIVIHGQDGDTDILGAVVKALFSVF